MALHQAVDMQSPQRTTGTGAGAGDQIATQPACHSTNIISINANAAPLGQYPKSRSRMWGQIGKSAMTNKVIRTSTQNQNMKSSYLPHPD
jgi:hypothetical protein